MLDAKLEAKLAKKLIKRPLVGKLAEKAKMFKNTVFFNEFWSLGLPTSRATWPKILPKPIRNLSKNWTSNAMQFMIDFWTILGRFGRDVGGQDGSKIEQKSTKKPCQKHIRKRALEKKLNEMQEAPGWPLRIQLHCQFPGTGRQYTPQDTPQTWPEARWRIYELPIYRICG